MVADEVYEDIASASVCRRGGGFIVGVDSEGSFLVDICVAHSHQDWKCGDVHHEDVEDEKALAEMGDCYNVESTGADGWIG